MPLIREAEPHNTNNGAGKAEPFRTVRRQSRKESDS